MRMRGPRAALSGLTIMLLAVSCREEAAGPPYGVAPAVEAVRCAPDPSATAVYSPATDPGGGEGPIPELPDAPPAFAESFEALHRVRTTAFEALHAWPERASARHLLPFADTVDDTNGEPWRLVYPGFALLGGFGQGPHCVYLSEDDPYDFAFASLPRREPDAFEREAAEALLEGGALVMQRPGGEVRMLGALRCTAACVRCHDGPPGALLGAFSYTFREMADD